MSGFRKGAVNRPSAFVVRLMTAPVAVSFNTTAAPGTAAPLESVTVPLIDPVVEVWATAVGSEIRPAMRPKAAAKAVFRQVLLMQICMTLPHTRAAEEMLSPHLAGLVALHADISKSQASEGQP